VPAEAGRGELLLILLLLILILLILGAMAADVSGRREVRRLMISLTRLNGNTLIVNSDLIKYAEASPDTMLTLVNGEKIVVLESCEEVIRRTIGYRARVFGEAAGHLQALAVAAAGVSHVAEQDNQPSRRSATDPSRG
jgi:flagellar protein FlbD